MRETNSWVVCGVVLVCLSGVTACVAPMPVVRLSPLSPADVTWVSGLAVLHQDRDDVEVAVAFDRHDGENLAFRVEIFNKTSERMEVMPSQMTYVICKGQTPSTGCSPLYPAVDPEAALESIDDARSREVASATNSQTLGTSLLLLSVVSDVGSIASGKRGSGLASASLAGSLQEDADQHRMAIGELESERDKWAIAALRRTTLLPEHSMAGYVFVPTDVTAQTVWLQVQVGRRRFPFAFHQVAKTPEDPAAGKLARPHDWPDTVSNRQ